MFKAAVLEKQTPEQKNYLPVLKCAIDFGPIPSNEFSSP